jgi:hypothetical protein
MKTLYSVSLEAVLPVLCRITVEASSEAAAVSLAVQIAESDKMGVKAAFQIEHYPADFLKLNGVAEIIPVDSADLGRRVWNRETIEALL